MQLVICLMRQSCHRSPRLSYKDDTDKKQKQNQKSLYQKWMWQLVGCQTHANDYDNRVIFRSWGSFWHRHICHFYALVSKQMSKIAITTSCVVLFVVALVFMYGHGYKSGRNAQLTMEATIEIAKSQFKCEMNRK